MKKSKLTVAGFIKLVLFGVLLGGFYSTMAQETMFGKEVEKQTFRRENRVRSGISLGGSKSQSASPSFRVFRFWCCETEKGSASA